MHTLRILKLLISPRHHIIVWRFSHHLKHLVGVVQYHFSVTPRNSRHQKRHNLNVMNVTVSVRKLHRIVFYKIYCVVFLNQRIQIAFQIFHNSNFCKNNSFLNTHLLIIIPLIPLILLILKNFPSISLSFN